MTKPSIIDLFSRGSEPRERNDLSRYRGLLRQEQYKKWNIDALRPKERAQIKNSIEKKIRQRTKHLDPREIVTDLEVLLNRSLSKHPILDLAYPRRNSDWILPVKRRGPNPEITVDNFSCIDNPVGVFSTIQSIARCETQAPSARINFEDEYVHDVTSYMLLAEFWDHMSPVFNGGQIHQSVAKVIDHVGLRSRLKMALPPIDNTDLWAFPLQRRRPAGTTRDSDPQLKTQTREVVCDRLCDAIDNWLGVDEISGQLSPHGRGEIIGIAGEIMDNAERFSGPVADDGDWSVAAFMARRDNKDGSSTLKCHLGFLSVGRSIFESLSTGAEGAKDAAYRYAGKFDRNPQSAFFQALVTIYALQDGVTSDPEAWAQGRGGTGLQDVVSLANALGGLPNNNTSARVTIVSGPCAIHLRPPYIEVGGSSTGTQNRTIWLNRQNSHELPPDNGCIDYLPFSFPGTSISVVFTMSPDFLRDEKQYEPNS